MATGPWEPKAAGAVGRGRLRASDADREQVIDALKAAFVQGLLTRDELGTRAGQALASRTYAELAVIAGGIPAGLTETQPSLKPARACAAKRVNKKRAAWGAGVIVLPPALGTAFLTYYGGFLVLLLLAFIGTMGVGNALRPPASGPASVGRATVRSFKCGPDSPRGGQVRLTGLSSCPALSR